MSGGCCASVDSIAAEYDPGIRATITLPLPQFADYQAAGLDVLHGLEQPLLAREEGGNLVIGNLLVKECPILLRVSHRRQAFLPAVLRSPSS